MTDYFDRLEAELGMLTRQGAHLGAGRRWATVRARRATAALLVTLLLAITIVSEFPSDASGRVTAIAAARV
jgi:hypothetical protein